MSAPTPRRIALVGCGKQKLTHAAPARELYTGPLFRSSLAVAEAEFGADVWILSAQHGLVDLDEQLEPYDLTLDDLTPESLQDWARDVLRNLVDDDHGTPARLTVYAGRNYVEQLGLYLPDDWTLEDPLVGLGQGARLAWLKTRLTRLSSSPTAMPLTSSAVPAGPASLESTVSSTARLTQEQREQSFHTALELERALAELPALRERLFQELARREESMRVEHQRQWHAATTGENPDARPQQQSLLDETPAPAPSKPAPRKDEQPEPEPPKGGKRPRRRAATEAKGEKRTGATASARTATVAEAAPQDEDAVPAPAVPCCTCGESLADHTGPKGEMGACHAKKCGAKPRCKAFQLGQVHGWTLRWGGGWKETNDKPVFCLAPPGSPSVSIAFGPLFPHDGSLYSSDPEHPEQVTDALAEARTHGSWSGLPGLRGVPLRVLEAVAAVLVPPSPAVPTIQELPPPAAPPGLGSETEERAEVSLDSVTLEEVRDLSAVKRLLHGRQHPSPDAYDVRRITSVLALSAREESWLHLPGEVHWRIVLNPHAEGGEVWLSYDSRAFVTAGPWRWDGQTLAHAEDWAFPLKWPFKTTDADAELSRLEPVLRAALVAAAESPSPTPETSSSDTWRVELPERNERSRIVLLWLVNDATGERRAAIWSLVTGLKPSHHLAGTLRGEALAEHAALHRWWTEHLESVVAPLVKACGDGAVPGLRFGAPTEPLADGPFFYALSGGWRLEVWDAGDKPAAHFVEPSGERHGPFEWEQDGLVADMARATWAAENHGHMVEAEDFIRRGFVPEFRVGGER